MANVLLGWEIGEGLHHVRSLQEVARALRAQGHEPILALQNLLEPWPLLAGEGFRVVQAPCWPPRRRAGEPLFLAATFADVLAMRGYDRIETLEPQVTAWQHLLELVRPALVVADYAPTLCLAARDMVPVVQVGSWFEMPAIEAPWFPWLVKDRVPVIPQQRVFDVIQEMRRRQGRPPLPTLTSFLAGDRFVTLLPELDPHRPIRKEPAWDPLDPLPAPVPLPAQPHFFAYLTAEYVQAEAMLTALALTGCAGTVYLRSLGDELGARLKLQGLTVLDQPAPLATVLARSTVLVHHGGVGSTQTALALGRPQLVLPQHLEQSINAMHLQTMGVGIGLGVDAAAQAVERALQQLQTDPKILERTASWARLIHERPRRPALPAIVECCLGHLGR